MATFHDFKKYYKENLLTRKLFFKNFTEMELKIFFITSEGFLEWQK